MLYTKQMQPGEVYCYKQAVKQFTGDAEGSLLLYEEPTFDSKTLESIVRQGDEFMILERKNHWTYIIVLEKQIMGWCTWSLSWSCFNQMI